VRLNRAVAIAAFLACGCALDAQAQLRSRLYASGLTLPVAFVQDPTNRSVQFVVEQSGRIRVVKAGAVLATDFLNLTPDIAFGGERGLLGMAFAPDYATSGRFFVNFTNPSGATVVARFRRSSDPLVADANSRFDLRWGGANGPAFIAQPFANHNGGNLAFGPDGFLYIGLGDGGSGDDPDNRAQTPSELLGKMLRIDVNVADADPTGYRVPPDNPFVGNGLPGARPEIWSVGLRNPWRYNFDDPARGGTGALVIGDVGQDQWEEIDYEPPNRGGRNYGWRYREGAHDHVTARPPAFLPLVDPIHEYDHATGRSISGGYVYRGRALGAAYRGRYFFADFVRGRVWSIGLTIDPATGDARKSDLVEHTTELGGSTLGNISSFGVDADGELYVVGYSSGKILKLLGRGLDGDFDGDGLADLALYRPSTGIWYVLQSSTSYMSYAADQWGLDTDIPVPGDYDGDGRNDLALYRPSEGAWHILRSGTNFTTALTQTWGLSTDIPLPGDYDGDGKSDLALYRPSTGVWYILQSSTNYATALVQPWGLSTDIPAPGDYDGDGKTDLALYRPSTGFWYILQSSTNYTTYLGQAWGLATDIPVPGDYDGDGKTDLGLYRPSTGVWYILKSSANYTTYLAQPWGLDTDIPVPGDYDGDGKTDFALYRPSTGVWYILQSSSNYTTHLAQPWGLAADVAVPGDYDGDGKTDLGLYRASTGVWYILLSGSGFTTTIVQPWGLATDHPVPGDYDGDGKTDLGLYRPSTGMWYLLKSSSGFTTFVAQPWGLATDLPVPGDYDGDGKTDLGLYRASTGTWYILQSINNFTTSILQAWGLSTDIPVLNRP
jgi:glucose/arabinose dehydrogenase